MAQVGTPQTDQPGRATIRDIARAAGVSIATVSRVLNGRPDVAPETREAVLEVVRQHSFTTNRTARGLSGGRTGLVGMTIPIIHAAYFSAILFGAGEALYEQDMRIVLCPTLHEHEREVTLLDRLMHGTTDGALLMLPSESGSELKALTERGYPFVVIDPMEQLDEGIASVSAANASGAKAATEHLLALGHTHIGAIIGPSTWLASRERVNGFHAALAGAGIAPDRSLEIPVRLRDPRRLRGRRGAARPAGPPDGDLRLQRQHRHRRDPRRPRARDPHSRRTSRSSASTTPRRRCSSRPR